MILPAIAIQAIQARIDFHPNLFHMHMLKTATPSRACFSSHCPLFSPHGHHSSNNSHSQIIAVARRWVKSAIFFHYIFSYASVSLFLSPLSFYLPNLFLLSLFTYLKLIICLVFNHDRVHTIAWPHRSLQNRAQCLGQVYLTRVFKGRHHICDGLGHVGEGTEKDGAQSIYLYTSTIPLSLLPQLPGVVCIQNTLFLQRNSLYSVYKVDP